MSKELTLDNAVELAGTIKRRTLRDVAKDFVAAARQLARANNELNNFLTRSRHILPEKRTTAPFMASLQRAFTDFAQCSRLLDGRMVILEAMNKLDSGESDRINKVVGSVMRELFEVEPDAKPFADWEPGNKVLRQNSSGSVIKLRDPDTGDMVGIANAHAEYTRWAMVHLRNVTNRFWGHQPT